MSGNRGWVEIIRGSLLAGHEPRNGRLAIELRVSAPIAGEPDHTIRRYLSGADAERLRDVLTACLAEDDDS